MVYHAIRGRLGMTEFLRAWIEETFRFVWLLPLDRLEPQPMPVQPYDRTLVGHWRSQYVYPCLFCQNQTEAAAEVDVAPLLSFVSRSLSSGKTNGKRTWLMHRISETNELMTGLMVKVGYVPDFPLESLAADSGNANKQLANILACLDSKLIVRCILEEEGGHEVLSKWIDGLSRSVHDILPDREVEAFGSDENPESLFGIFQDSAGFAVAALDCCRQRPPAAKEDVLRVYFLVDELIKKFRPKASHLSDGISAKERSLASITQPTDKPAMVRDPLAGLETRLRGMLVQGGFDAEGAAKLVRHWYESEGRERGETPRDLLADIESECFPQSVPSRIFSENVSRLLDHLSKPTR